MKRIKYWWQKLTCEHWQWGHPDEWSDAEWYYFDKERKSG